MIVVLDSVSLNQALRRNKRADRRLAHPTFVNPLDGPIQAHSLTLALDNSGGLLSEWFETCGEEAVKALIEKWEPLNGVRYIIPSRTIDRAISARLRRLGFPKGTDRLLLKIALATPTRIVVSEDAHFWQPGYPKMKGRLDATVCRYCREALAVEILLLTTLLRRLRAT